jgi:hypothetical protein
VDQYTGNAPLLASYLPGQVSSDDYENHPLLRKYYLAARVREEARLRADLSPSTEVNLGIAATYAEDDYDDGYFGLTRAKVRSMSFDAGWHPRETLSMTGFYTKEKYQSAQAARAFFNDFSAFDPGFDWFADTTDKVDTWNFAVTFSEVGRERGWNGLDFGFDYTFSNTRSDIEVTAGDLVFGEVGPLPQLQAKMRTFTLWGSFQLGRHSSIRLAAESSELSTSDWGLDGVVPDSLANVLLLGESSPNYDLWLLSGAWTYRFE